ncbi:hypothetical protein L6252_03190 [Candidatus Parcubacteria bacterium]|nr:hypothetical protein [Candidatus Parcubacteria bacterium]
MPNKKIIFNSSKRNSHKFLTGFTLIEVLITLNIFIFVFVACFAVYFLAQKFYQKAENRAETLQNGRIILERLNREIRQAVEIVSALPQSPDLPGNPPLSEIEFEDGHTPSPFAYLGSDYYYIRYYLDTNTSEIIRQDRVYCFEECSVCLSFVRWNDFKIESEEQIFPGVCNLEERVIGEYVSGLAIWGANLIDVVLILEKNNETINLKTKIAGRNF